jgi:two-component sensor histidine kinase
MALRELGSIVLKYAPATFPAFASKRLRSISKWRFTAERQITRAVPLSDDRSEAAAGRMGLFLRRQEGVLRAMASSTYSTSEEGLLLREMTHKNEFASAIQTMSFTAAKSPDGNVKAALAGAIAQLHNYARVDRALQMPANNDSIDALACLRDLCTIDQSLQARKQEYRGRARGTLVPDDLRTLLVDGDDCCRTHHECCA